MPVREVTYYEAFCDGCEKRIPLGWDCTAMADRDTVEDDITDGDGSVVGSLVLCCSCTLRIMRTAGDDDERWDTLHDLLRSDDEAAVRELIAAVAGSTGGETHGED